MTLGLTNTLKQRRATANRDAIDAAATPGKLIIYGGTRPATGEAATSDPLATFTLADPCGTVSGAGVLSLATPDPAQVTTTGNPTWARFTDGDNTVLFDASVGVAGSGAEVILDQTTLYAGAFVILLSAQFAEGG